MKRGRKPVDPECYWIVCPCGRMYARGLFADFEIECDQCGRKVFVPKFELPKD